MRKIYGIGINNADYTVCKTVDGRRVNCPFYKTWFHMLERCYSSSRKDKNQSYIGSTVVAEWHSFMTFRSWMIEQDWEGKELDKDLLIKDNNVYGPDVCIFVPCQLNTFAVDRAASRGNYPVGVDYYKRNSKFRAMCRNPFTKKREHLGLFDCPEEAHEAWRKRKHELACIYADMQTDERLSNALRTRYAAQEGKP